MNMRKTGFEKADRYGAAVERLYYMHGKTWIDPSEVALQAAISDESYMRWRRLANKGLRFLGIQRLDIPDKAPPLLYGAAETYASLAVLENAGLVESAEDKAMGMPTDDYAPPRTLYRPAPQAEPVFRPARVLHDPRDDFRVG